MYRLNRVARHMEPVAAEAATAAPQKILKGMKVVELATVVAVRTPTPAQPPRHRPGARGPCTGHAWPAAAAARDLPPVGDG